MTVRWRAAALVLALCLAGCGTRAADVTAEAPGTATAAEVAADEIRPLSEVPTPALPAMGPDGNEGHVEVSDVSRILPLNGSLAEIVFSLGLGDRVVGRDVSTTFADAADLPVVTHGHDVQAEGVLSLEPTVVLADTRTGPPETLQQLRDAGVTLLVFEEAWSLEEVAPRIRAVASALGVAAAGQRLVERTEAEIAAAADTAALTGSPRVAFLYLRGSAGVYLIGGEGSGADSMVEALGGVDAGSEAGLRLFTPLTSEALAAAAPDVLLVMEDGLASVGGEEGLVGLPGVAQTPAGEAARVVAVDDGLLLNFGPRTGRALQVLADQLVAELAS